MMKHWNLAFHYWANVRVLIDDRQCRHEWKGPNDSHTKAIHHVHRREAERDQMKEYMEQIVVTVPSLRTASNTLSFSTFGSPTRVGGNDINAFTIYTKSGNYSLWSAFACLFYLPFVCRWSVCVRLKIIKEPCVVERMTYTYIYITDRKVCLCELVLFFSLSISFNAFIKF